MFYLAVTMSENVTKCDTDTKLQVMGSVSVEYVSTYENTRYDDVQIQRGNRGYAPPPDLKITKNIRFLNNTGP